eukprot:5213755-Alexandrium_andersonii.AAC.1
MSASLVGSEMCIRDRSWKQALAPAQVPPRPQAPTPVPLRGRPLLRPVSYTHLTLPTICSV